jgi:hypothetical protein
MTPEERVKKHMLNVAALGCLGILLKYDNECFNAIVHGKDNQGVYGMGVAIQPEVMLSILKSVDECVESQHTIMEKQFHVERDEVLGKFIGLLIEIGLKDLIHNQDSWRQDMAEALEKYGKIFDEK